MVLLNLVGKVFKHFMLVICWAFYNNLRCSLLWLIITSFSLMVVVINIFYKLYKLKIILQSCQKVPTLGWGKECTKGVRITTTLQRAPLTLCNLNCQALWPGQPQTLLKLRKDSPKTHLPNQHLQGKCLVYK